MKPLAFLFVLGVVGCAQTPSTNVETPKPVAQTPKAPAPPVAPAEVSSTAKEDSRIEAQNYVDILGKEVASLFAESNGLDVAWRQNLATSQSEESAQSRVAAHLNQQSELVEGYLKRANKFVPPTVAKGLHLHYIAWLGDSINRLNASAHDVVSGENHETDKQLVSLEREVKEFCSEYDLKIPSSLKQTPNQ